MASASSGVRVEFPVNMCAPLEVTAPGKIMMKFVPSELIVFSTDLVAPLPMATTAITQPTPMTMPSIVRNERSLLREIALSPTIVMFQRRCTDVLMISSKWDGWDRWDGWDLWEGCESHSSHPSHWSHRSHDFTAAGAAGAAIPRSSTLFC